MVVGLASGVGKVVHPYKNIIYCDSHAPRSLSHAPRSLSTLYEVHSNVKLPNKVNERLSLCLWWSFIYLFIYLCTLLAYHNLIKCRDFLCKLIYHVNSFYSTKLHILWESDLYIHILDKFCRVPLHSFSKLCRWCVMGANFFGTSTQTMMIWESSCSVFISCCWVTSGMKVNSIVLLYILRVIFKLSATTLWLV